MYETEAAGVDLAKKKHLEANSREKYTAYSWVSSVRPPTVKCPPGQQPDMSS